jgi:hypothetical protein
VLLAAAVVAHTAACSRSVSCSNAASSLPWTSLRDRLAAAAAAAPSADSTVPAFSSSCTKLSCVLGLLLLLLLLLLGGWWTGSRSRAVRQAPAAL